VSRTIVKIHTGRPREIGKERRPYGACGKSRRGGWSEDGNGFSCVCPNIAPNQSRMERWACPPFV